MSRGAGETPTGRRARSSLPPCRILLLRDRADRRVLTLTLGSYGSAHMGISTHSGYAFGIEIRWRRGGRCNQSWSTTARLRAKFGPQSQPVARDVGTRNTWRPMEQRRLPTAVMARPCEARWLPRSVRLVGATPVYQRIPHALPSYHPTRSRRIFVAIVKRAR